MVNFGQLTAEICWRVWGTPANFNGFHILAALLHGTLVVGVSQTLWRLNTGRHLYSVGRPSRWALAHILVTKRSKAFIDRHDQFELLKNYSDAERLLCRQVKGPIYLLYHCAGNNISHSDDMCRL